VQALENFMRYVEFSCGVGEKKNMGMWASKNKKNWWVGWFHPVEWSKLIKK
jgi:hypothetical protein